MRAGGIVSPSGTGKTRVVEALAPRFDGRVATIECIYHPVERAVTDTAPANASEPESPGPAPGEVRVRDRGA